MSKEVKPTPSGMAVLTVRMPAAMIGKLGREAAARGVPVSVLVREAVEWKLQYGPSWTAPPPNPGNFYFVTWGS